MKVVAPAVAVAAIPDESVLILPGACAEPREFYRAFSADVERFTKLTVASGLSLGGYGFLSAASANTSTI